jgi:UDP-2-acetamido-3-amino-2,3-dideoxy-glucuronate N-acetyltransferase
MVGHLLHYHPVVRKLMALLKEGRIGDVKFVSSSRLNFGKLRTEEDVLWSFAPHDISVILAVVGEMPRSVTLVTTSIVSSGIADIADLHLRFPSGATARAFASWLNPFKEQKLVIVGTKGHAVFDDTLAWEDKLTIFDNTVVTENGRPQAKAVPGEKIAVPKDEPLRLECAHFLNCIQDGGTPRTDAEEALRVLAVLEAANQSGRTNAPAVPSVPVLAKSA